MADPVLVWLHAERRALTVMASCGGRLDWSGWIVDVHDDVGRHVCTLPFTDARVR